MKKLITIAQLLLIVLLPFVAKAGEKENAVKQLDYLKKEIYNLENDFIAVEAKYLSPFALKDKYSESHSKKMEKGDYYFSKKDYISSGSIFYSVYSSRKDRDFIWEESLFKLAESLFNNNNYISAVRYYEMLLTAKPNSRFQIEVLKRLIASAYFLGEYSKAIEQ